MRRAGITALLALAGLAAGCAEGTPSADLLVVQRSGANPGADLTMVISDGGFVRCNDGPERAITSQDLIDARALARAFNDDDRDEEEGLFGTTPSLPARPGSQVRYTVRGEDGSSRFADNSADAPQEFLELAALVRRLAKGPCGLAR